MSKLSLDQFKAKADANQADELEALTGGILGNCHPSGNTYPKQALYEAIWDMIF